MNSENNIAFISIGGSETPIESISQRAFKAMREGGIQEKTSAADTLNILWSGIDIAKLLTEHSWSVMTGGYYLGNLGMASKTAASISDRQLGLPKPVGVVFDNWFPDDPLTISGENKSANSLSERQKIFLDNASTFFLMGGGGLGTLCEIFSSFKDDALHDEVLKYGKPKDVDNLQLRPFIVVDPTEKTHKLLTFVFDVYFDRLRRDTDPIVRGLLERIYLFGRESFRKLDNPQYPGLLRLGNSAKDNIINILDHYTQSAQNTPRAKTLFQYLSPDKNSEK